MLITFTCEGYSDIIMFADVGLRLLGLMGYPDKQSGDISPQEAELVLKRLNTALAGQTAKSTATSGPSNQNEDFSELPVSLQNRALPLIDLLNYAIKEKHSVSWKAK